MDLNAIQREIKEAETVGTRDRFFERHPGLFALTVLYLGVYWLLRAALWVAAFLLIIFGLKALWLLALYAWNLV